MTTSAVRLQLQPRELMRKKVGRLRRAGIVPVHLYGPSIESRALQCAAPTLVRALAEAGGSSPITVTVEGEAGSHLAFAREIQWDPRRDTVLHLDLMAADVSQPITAQVSVTLIGESPGAVRVGGYVSQQVFDILVSALPLELPAQIEMDLAVLTDLNSVLRTGDIVLPSGVTLQTDPEEMVARVEAPRAETEDHQGEAGGQAQGEESG